MTFAHLCPVMPNKVSNQPPTGSSAPVVYFGMGGLGREKLYHDESSGVQTT